MHTWYTLFGWKYPVWTNREDMLAWKLVKSRFMESVTDHVNMYLDMSGMIFDWSFKTTALKFYFSNTFSWLLY